jgi:hypothetical protein
MRRLALSALGGIVIPLTYARAVIGLERVFDEGPFSVVVIAPVAWADWIYCRLFTCEPPRLSPFVPLSNLLFLYLGNFLLYSLLTYAFLTWMAKRQKLRAG